MAPNLKASPSGHPTVLSLILTEVKNTFGGKSLPSLNKSLAVKAKGIHYTCSFLKAGRSKSLKSGVHTILLILKRSSRKVRYVHFAVPLLASHSHKKY